MTETLEDISITDIENICDLDTLKNIRSNSLSKKTEAIEQIEVNKPILKKSLILIASNLILGSAATIYGLKENNEFWTKNGGAMLIGFVAFSYLYFSTRETNKNLNKELIAQAEKINRINKRINIVESENGI